MYVDCLIRAADTAGLAGGPQLPGVTTPLVHVLGTGQVGGRVARSLATGTSVPVVAVHLPESDVPLVSIGLTRVVAHSVGVSTGFVLHDALAVSLVKFKKIFEINKNIY